MKIKSVLLTALAMGSFGILASQGDINAKASLVYESGYLKDTNEGQTVTTKRSLKTNLYRNINGKKVRFVIPKGTTLTGGTSSDKQSNGKYTTSINFSFNQYSYAFKSKFTTWSKDKSVKNVNLAFKSADFKLVKGQPAAVLGTSWERGKDFSLDKVSYPQMFAVTNDKYIQFYSNASIKKAKIFMNFANGLDSLKPTTTRKIIAVKTSGKNVTYLYYTKPITGLVEHKVRSGLYRLKINTQGKKSASITNGDDFVDATWQRAYVGGKNYNSVIDYEEGD